MQKNAAVKPLAITEQQAKKNEAEGIMGSYMLPEMTATTARLKLDAKTPGYIPIKSELRNSKGETRLFKNYETDQYFVTDNQGNIIGDSYDPNAVNPNFKGWNMYTGSLDDARRAEAGELRNIANINEVNQLDRQKKERQLMGEEGLIPAIQQGREKFAKSAGNFVSNSSNIINHAILGPIRAAVNDNYSMQDYAQGFNVAKFGENINQTIGLGDVAEVENPYLRGALNFANPTTLASTRINLPQGRIVPGKGKIYNVKVDAPIVSKYTYTKRPVYAKGWGNEATTGKLNQQWAFPTAPTLQTTPGSISSGAYNTMFFNMDQKAPQTSKPIPTAVFEYSGVPDNRTVLGRIRTGDFVPGTTSPEWTPGKYNSKIYDNIRGHRSTAFEGAPAGKAATNRSDWYLPISYKKNGEED